MPSACAFMLVFETSAAFSHATPTPPFQEIHLLSLNIGSHARMRAMNSESVLASHDLHSGSDGTAGTLLGAFPGGSTSYLYHGAMRYVRARDVLADDLASRLFGASGSSRASSSRRPPDARLPDRGTKRNGNYQGWRGAGTGRRKGSRLNISEQMRHIILVKLSVLAHKALATQFETVGNALIARSGL